MGCGKTTAAEELAREKGYQRIEMDEEIVKRAGKPITRIFEEDGEDSFRNMETGLLLEIGKKERTVVSCGGGTALRTENVDIMRKSGTIILLTASPEVIYERVKASEDRPLLNDNMTLEHIQDLMERRRKAYERAADCVISTDRKYIRDIIEEILNATK